jgi:hypothetical protein
MPHAFLGAPGLNLENLLWEHVANIREHVMVWYMRPKGQGIDWNTNRFTRECSGWIQNREQRQPMQSRSWSPRVWSQAEFWICYRGHQDASPPKIITAFGWVDHREHGHQSRAAMLFMKVARDGGILGQIGCGKETDWAKANDWAQSQGIVSKAF